MADLPVKSPFDGILGADAPEMVPARRNTPPVGLPQVPQTLRGVEDSVWELLQQGVEDRSSQLHTLTLGTMSPDGFPDQRVVVLRAVDRVSRTLRINTDRRSPKFQQMQSNPRVSLLGYAARSKVSLRMTGIAHTESGTKRARTVWDGMRAMSRDCYRVGVAPSSPLSSPEESPLDAFGEDEAFDNFALVHMILMQVEWLYLRHGGHMRARLSWYEQGAPGAAPEATWLVA